MILAGAGLAVVAVAAIWFFWWRGPGTTVKVETATVVAISGRRDSATVDVLYTSGQGGGCGDPAGVEVREHDDRVVFTAHVRYVTGRKDRACALAGVQRREAVTLSRPLGSRDPIDGHTEQRVPLVAPTPTPD